MDFNRKRAGLAAVRVRIAFPTRTCIKLLASSPPSSDPARVAPGARYPRHTRGCARVARSCTIYSGAHAAGRVWTRDPCSPRSDLASSWLADSELVRATAAAPHVCHCCEPERRSRRAFPHFERRRVEKKPSPHYEITARPGRARGDDTGMTACEFV